MQKDGQTNMKIGIRADFFDINTFINRYSILIHPFLSLFFFFLSYFSYGVGLAEARVVQLRILVDEHRELLRKIQRDEMEEGEVRILII